MVTKVEPDEQVHHEVYGEVTVHAVTVRHEGFEVERDGDGTVFCCGSHGDWEEYVEFTDQNGVKMQQELPEFVAHTNIL